MGKNLSSKYCENLLDSTKKSTTDAIKTASEKATQKIAEATGHLIGNKTADKITIISKSSAKHSMEQHSKNDDTINEITKTKIHISRRKTTNY